MDQQSFIEELDENWPTYWQVVFMILGEYAAFCDKFKRVVEHVKRVGDGKFGSMEAVQRRIKLDKTEITPSSFASYRAGPKARDFENPESSKCSPWSLSKLFKQSGP